MRMVLRAVTLAAGPSLTAAAAATSIPHCTDFIAPSRNETRSVSGTFDISFRFCEPTAQNASRADILQILVHGAMYGKNYWLWPQEPETYSYGRAANARGYPVLAYDRLGNGLSERPDGRTVTQTSLEIAIAVEIVHKVRAGTLHKSVRAFHKVVQLGHSLGSVITNGAVAADPDALDAVVLTGYTHTPSQTFDIIKIGGLEAARTASPLRFGLLPESYMTNKNSSGKAVAEYGPPGSFDESVLLFDELTRDTVTWGQYETLVRGIPGAAVGFAGHVLTITGAEDKIFCDPLPGCDNLQAEAGKTFYPDAASIEIHMVQNAGHVLNLLLSAPATYARILDWIAGLAL